MKVTLNVAFQTEEAIILNWYVKNRRSLFAVLKYFQLEASNQLCVLQFQNYTIQMTFNASFTQGLKKWRMKNLNCKR